MEGIKFWPPKLGLYAILKTTYEKENSAFPARFSKTLGTPHGGPAILQLRFIGKKQRFCFPVAPHQYQRYRDSDLLQQTHGRRHHAQPGCLGQGRFANPPVSRESGLGPQERTQVYGPLRLWRKFHKPHEHPTRFHLEQLLRSGRDRNTVRKFNRQASKFAKSDIVWRIKNKAPPFKRWGFSFLRGQSQHFTAKTPSNPFIFFGKTKAISTAHF